MPRLRGLRDPEGRPEVAGQRGREPRGHGVHLWHRLRGPLPVLHVDVRLPHDPRQGPGVRDRPQAREPRARRVGDLGRRRRPLDRRQPSAAPAAARRQPPAPAVQQRDLRSHEGAGLPDVAGRDGDTLHATGLRGQPGPPGLVGARRGGAGSWPAGSTSASSTSNPCSSTRGPTAEPRSSRSSRTASCSTTAASRNSPTARCPTSGRSWSSTASRCGSGRTARQGLRFDPKGWKLEVVDAGPDGVPEDDLLVHDETSRPAGPDARTDATAGVPDGDRRPVPRPQPGSDLRRRPARGGAEGRGLAGEAAPGRPDVDGGRPERRPERRLEQRPHERPQHRQQRQRADEADQEAPQRPPARSGCRRRAPRRRPGRRPTPTPRRG